LYLFSTKDECINNSRVNSHF